MRTSDDHRLSHKLIGEIYDCALDPAKWDATLAAIADYREAISVGIAIFDLIGRSVTMQLMSQKDSRANVDFAETYSALMPPELYDTSRMTVDRSVCAEDAMERSAFERSRFYREWAEPNGIADSVASCLMKDARRFAMATCLMPRRATTRDRQLAELFGPHLRRAATIADLLNPSALKVRDLSNALSALSLPVLLVNESGEVIFANSAAEELLRRGRPLRLVSRRLSLEAPRLTNALLTAVSRAIRSRDETATTRIGVPPSALDPVGSILHVLPLERRFDGTQFASPLAAIFVARQGRELSSELSALAEVYGLTSTECVVMLQLARGETLEEIAVARECARSTVRSHVLRLLAKTGAKRQSDLVRIVQQLNLSR